VKAIDYSGKRSSGVDVVVGLMVFGLYLVGIALFAAVAPGTFHEEVGPFGPRSDHYIHDVAAFQGAVGVFALLAARRPAWWVPAITITLFQFALHTVSHLIDMSDADPEWLGVLEFVALTLATAVLVWLLARARSATSVSPADRNVGQIERSF
jgi:hypothetical protein